MTTMAASLLARKLIVVTGKGGTGKTTVAAALGLIAAKRGLRTIVAELGGQHRLPVLFEHSEPERPSAEIALEQHLWCTSIDPQDALFEWLHTIGGRISVRMLASSSTFNYFAAAAPGAKELVSMIKARELCERREGRDARGRDGHGYEDARDGRPRCYDLVILDAPATGHALAMLHSPKTFSAIVRVGQLADQAQKVQALLESRERCACVAVTHATEMAVTETLELEDGLKQHLNRDLDAIFVNGTVPRRFTASELTRIASIADPRSLEGLGEDAPLAAASLRTARAVYERARLQRAQLARLRRQHSTEDRATQIVTIPFSFTPHLDLAGVREIAARLERKLT